MGAAEHGHLKLVKLLLSKGAKVNEQTAYLGNYTALTIASRNDHTSVVQLLLEAGANVNASEHDGKTALIWLP